MDGCSPDLVCKNNICEKCTIGCPGMYCDSKTVCQEQYSCVANTCQPCSARDVTLSGTTSTTGVGFVEPFATEPICHYCDKRTMSCRGSPCERAADCDTDEQCSWGLCKKCTEGCLGMSCKSYNDCTTGYCNKGKCDYPKKASWPKTGQQEPMGRRSPCGPGMPCDKKQKGVGAQPVFHGQAHSRGAGQSEAEKVKPTATA
jgi:hypothetical protein